MAEVASIDVSQRAARSVQDIDDLDDRENIEAHVSGSGTVLLLLDRGYLTDRQCLEEVRFAVGGGKPLVRVHDAGGRVESLVRNGERRNTPC